MFALTHQMYIAYWSMLSSHMKCVKVHFCRIISFCVQAEHDQLPTKGCSGRWLQVWPWVFFRARLAILLCLQMIYIFLIDKIRKILRYLSSVSDPPAINDWKRGLEIVVLFWSCLNFCFCLPFTAFRQSRRSVYQVMESVPRKVSKKDSVNLQKSASAMRRKPMRDMEDFRWGYWPGKKGGRDLLRSAKEEQKLSGDLLKSPKHDFAIVKLPNCFAEQPWRRWR